MQRILVIGSPGVGRARSDLPWFEADFDPDFYEYVRRFPEEQLLDILVRLAEHPEQTIVTLKNRDEGKHICEN